MQLINACRFWLLLLLAVMPLAHANSLDFLQQEDSFLPVEQAFEFESEVIAPGKVEIFWRIADGYYLYKEKLKFEADGVEIEPIELPPGHDHEDEFFGKTQVYYQSLMLQVNYQAEANSQLLVTYDE